jgi:hypothetical protein
MVFGMLLVGTVPVLDVLDLLAALIRPTHLLEASSILLVSVKVSFQHDENRNEIRTWWSIKSPPLRNESISTSGGGLTVQSEQNHSMSATSTTSWLIGG